MVEDNLVPVLVQYRTQKLPGFRAEPVDGALDGFGQHIDLVETAFVFVVMLIIDPAVGFVEVVELFYTVVENGRVEEVLQHDMRVGIGRLVFFTEVGQLSGPFTVVEYLSSGRQWWILFYKAQR